MEIKRLTRLDAETYRNIRLEALKNNPDAYATSYDEEKIHTAEKYKTRFQSNESVTLGAFEGGTLIGVVTLVREKLAKLNHRSNIVAMYVAPKKRGIGIGKRLMVEAIKLAKGIEGIEQIHLTVVTTNQQAKKLYSSLGFTVIGREEKAMKLGTTYLDEEHMVLFLE